MFLWSISQLVNNCSLGAAAIGTPKNRLMISRHHLNRIIIISFMVLIGFSLAKAIYHKSFMGITLALVSLSAAIYFLYILAKAKEEMEAEEAA
jgi:Ca2+/Na+ antiporter